MQKSADLKNLYYPFWVRAGGPSAREGRARGGGRGGGGGGKQNGGGGGFFGLGEE